MLKLRRKKTPPPIVEDNNALFLEEFQTKYLKLEKLCEDIALIISYLSSKTEESISSHKTNLNSALDILENFHYKSLSKVEYKKGEINFKTTVNDINSEIYTIESWIDLNTEYSTIEEDPELIKDQEKVELLESQIDELNMLQSSLTEDKLKEYVSTLLENLDEQLSSLTTSHYELESLMLLYKKNELES